MLGLDPANFLRHEIQRHIPIHFDHRLAAATRLACAVTIV
jgi:hypothetical protein